MKSILKILCVVAIVVTFVGCENDNEILNPAPAAPQGVYTITGDDAVYLYWNGPYEVDLKEYIILRSFEEFENYTEIARVTAESNRDLDLLIYEYIDTEVQNSKTYFYAVVTVDKSRQESDLSAESVFDTPRPQGEVTLYPVSVDGSIAGFNLVTETVVSYLSEAADFYLEYNNSNDIYFITVGNVQIDIQDMGFSYDFDQINYAPDTGWSQFSDMELILGHTYVLWTDTDNYAKLRPVQIFNSGAVKFEWAFQADAGNRELKIIPPEGQGPVGQ